MNRRQLLRLSTATLSTLHVANSMAQGPGLPNAAANPILTRVETALGNFTIAVDPARAPKTVANYLAYVDRRWLDGGSVYRIVTLGNQPSSAYKIEVVQWGMDYPDEKPPPLPAVVHETTADTGLLHRHGTVSMARNGPGTASSEFFICIGDQPELDFGGHRNSDGLGFAAFGQVVAGMDNVIAMHRKGTDDQYLKPPIEVRTVRRQST